MEDNKPSPENWIRNCEFRYKCDLKWADLAPTDNGLVRFCKACHQNVYMVLHEAALVNAIKDNRCVYIGAMTSNLDDSPMGLPSGLRKS